MPEKKRTRTSAVLFIRGLSKPVKLLFKKKVVGRELTMNVVTEALLRFYLDNGHLVEPYIQQVLRSERLGEGDRDDPGSPRPRR